MAGSAFIAPNSADGGFIPKSFILMSSSPSIESVSFAAAKVLISIVTGRVIPANVSLPLKEPGVWSAFNRPMVNGVATRKAI